MKMAILENVNDPCLNYWLDSKETTIGRRADCDVLLKSGRTSREHAIIKREETKFILYDKSANGTSVKSQALTANSGSVKKGIGYILASGDLITFGDACEQYLFKEVSRAKNKSTDDIENNGHLKTNLFVDPITFLRRRIIGNSPAIQNVHRMAAKAMQNQITVLITGETGTGKGLLARTIHDGSRGLDGPFIDVNCAALSPNLIESELFGHEPGAYTGAKDRRVGRFELADGGTIFLDEIGDMPSQCQVKLLHVLEGRGFQRVGGSTTIETDVRVIAATNCDLKEAIQQKLFREDLYYRLNVLLIRIPPLRERPEDIPEMVDFFLNKSRQKIKKPSCQLSENVMDVLKTYHYSGNVRELANVVERACIEAEDSEIHTADLSFLNETLTMNRCQSEIMEGSSEFLQEQEKINIKKALYYCKGIIRHAAARLSMAPNTLYKRLKQYHIDPGEWDEWNTFTDSL